MIGNTTPSWRLALVCRQKPPLQKEMGVTHILRIYASEIKLYPYHRRTDSLRNQLSAAF